LSVKWRPVLQQASTMEVRPGLRCEISCRFFSLKYVCPSPFTSLGDASTPNLQPSALSMVRLIARRAPLNASWSLGPGT
jgi:hypothetical protein